MKPWKPQVQERIEPMRPVSVDVQPSGFECVGCSEKASMVFEGTSYCRECLQYKLKTGIERRFYAR
jgi:uncharacterized protein CbrC (UPF0167 family)